MPDVTTEEKKLYHYHCRACGNERVSVKIERANAGVCLKCKRNEIPETQMPLF